MKARKFGYDVSVRTTKRANAVRTDSGGGGGASRSKAHGDLRNAIFSRRNLSEKKTHCICYVDKRSGTLI